MSAGTAGRRIRDISDADWEDYKAACVVLHGTDSEITRIHVYETIARWREMGSPRDVPITGGEIKKGDLFQSLGRVVHATADATVINGIAHINGHAVTMPATLPITVRRRSMEEEGEV